MSRAPGRSGRSRLRTDPARRRHRPAPSRRRPRRPRDRAWACAGRSARAAAPSAAVLATAIAVTACAAASVGPDAGVGAAPGPAPECVLEPGEPDGSTLVVAAPGAVDARNAPVPASPAERLLFRHLYETLVRVDCRGRRLPGLAASWTSEEGGMAWRLTLRPGAAFWDGGPVTAEDVVAAWRAPLPGEESTRAGPAGVGGAAADPPADDPATGVVWAEALERHLRARLRLLAAAAAEVVDARTLRIRLAAPAAEPPLWLADPALAVHRPSAPGDWPSGTGEYRLHPAAARDAAGPEGLAAYPAARTPGDPRPVLRFRAYGSRDPRELLDAGADLLVTDDPEALAYAVSLGRTLLPLPWDRTYSLAGAGAEPDAAQEEGALALSEALARDAVRAEARPAASESGRGDGPRGLAGPSSHAAEGAEHASAACPLPAPAAGGASGSDGADPGTRSATKRADGGGARPGPEPLAYPRGDPTARELAERLAVLAGSGDPALPAWVRALPRTVAPSGRERLGAALEARDGPAVLPAPGGGSACPAVWAAGGAPLRPLVEARRRAALAARLGGLALDGDGTLLLSRAGRAGADGGDP